MKNKIILFTGVVIILALLLFPKTQKHPQAKAYTIENRKYYLLTADSIFEWEKGLMNIRKKEGFDGMIFIFPKKDIQTFWNKNTYMDLDIIWLEDEKVIGRSFLPSIEKSKKIVTVTSPHMVNKVVELIR